MYSSSSSGRSNNPRYGEYEYRSSYRREYDYNTEEDDELSREQEQNEYVSPYSRPRILTELFLYAKHTQDLRENQVGLQDIHSYKP